ncbi:MAG: NYN domain-containing protein [Sphingobacteriales bacterium]
MNERVIAYIDGFNLYFGMKEAAWGNQALWLDVQKLTLNLLKSPQVLIETNYFTSRISNNPPKQARQNAYLDALQTLSNFEIYYGKYNSQDRTCQRCGDTYSHSAEKMTDVNIACRLLSDAFQDRFDTAFLITGDSDLVPPIELIHSLFPNKRVFVAFPPNRHNLSVGRVAKGSMIIGRKKLIDSQFPNQVAARTGFILNRPLTWS